MLHWRHNAWVIWNYPCFRNSLTESIVLYNGLGSHMSMVPEKNLIVYFKVCSQYIRNTNRNANVVRSDGRTRSYTQHALLSSSCLSWRFTNDCLQSSTWSWRSMWWGRSLYFGLLASWLQRRWTASLSTVSGIDQSTEDASTPPISTTRCRFLISSPTWLFSSCLSRLWSDCRFRKPKRSCCLVSSSLVACKFHPQSFGGIL